MLSYDTATGVLRERWRREVAESDAFAALGLSNGLPTAYPNVAFLPPDGPWARLGMIVFPEVEMRTFHPRLYRHSGTVWAMLHVARGSGDGLLAELSDLVCSRYGSVTDNGVKIGPGSVGNAVEREIWFTEQVVFAVSWEDEEGPSFA